MRKAKIEKETILLSSALTMICTVFCSVVSARLRAPDAIGFSFDGLGAAFGLMLGAGLSGLIYRRESETILASIAMSAPLMYAIAKIGCHFAGCCKGILYAGMLAVRYEDYGEQQFFPIQLLESAIFLAIFVFLLAKRSKYSSLRMIELTVLLSLIAKFLLDFLRDTHVSALISLNQVVIMLFLAGFIAFASFAKNKIVYNKYKDN